MKAVILIDKDSPEDITAMVEDNGFSSYLEGYGNNIEEAKYELKHVIANRIKLLREIDVDQAEVREV
jgi:hypothetical protein